MTSPRELMQVHLEALFTHDTAGDLVCVNEPEGPLAPRFFIGHTVEGPIWRFRHDVDPTLRAGLIAAIEADRCRAPGFRSHLVSPEPYAVILQRVAPVQRTWAGPAFYAQPALRVNGPAIPVTEENAHVLQPLFEEWRSTVQRAQPMIALLVDGYAVSLCCSVRRTCQAHEAGVETAPAYRGRGYAAQVVSAWVEAVHVRCQLPLYSTSWQNHASRSLAHRLGLLHFGNDLHLA